MNFTMIKFGNGIGTEIKRIRKQQHVGRDVIADKAGLDYIYYDKIERNKKDISLQTLIKIAAALEKPILMFEKFIKK